MRSLVLSIAAIAAVQLAFQIFLVDDQRSEYEAAVATASWPADTTVTAVADVRPAPGTVGGSLARAKHQQPLRRRAAPVRTAYRRAGARVRTALTAKAATHKRPKVVRPDVPEEEERDGKPWIAKALPVIKKPYDWLKSLVDKLN